MQRPERVILIGISAIACGVTATYIGGDHKWYLPGISFHVLETMSIFTIPIALMAVLTNITALKRLTGAQKTLDSRDEAKRNASQEISGNKLLTGLAVLVMSGVAFTTVPDQGKKPAATTHPVSVNTAIEPQDTFPVPTGNPLQLFYLQRTANTNTIVCELNYDKSGKLNEESPVHVFWIRYPEGGMRKELNYIQRVFAYGIKSQPIGNGAYKLNFVSYRKQTFTLMPSPKDNKYRVYATINQKHAQLTRLFVKVDGGTFWSPNVVYMEMKGIDVATGKEVVERFKP